MTLGPFVDVQDEVYLKALPGEQPTLLFGRRTAEAAARAVVSPEAVGHVPGGSGGGTTGRAAGLSGPATVRAPSSASRGRT